MLEGNGTEVPAISLGLGVCATALKGHALDGFSCADLPECGSALHAEERFVAALD